jgi:hypothetical protein
MWHDIPFCKDSRSYPYWSEWTDGRLVAIADDSLAVVATYKYKTECEVGDDYGTEITTSSRAGVFLVNYRVKQKPLLGDTLELRDDLNYDLEVATGYLKDSSVLIFDFVNRKFGIWKVGEKSIEFNTHDDIGLSKDIGEFSGIRANPWVNKSVILNYYHIVRTKQILDTKNGQIKPFEHSEEYEWMYDGERNFCLDGFLSYLEDKDKIICIRTGNDIRRSELIVDGVITDIGLNVSIQAQFGNYIDLGVFKTVDAIKGGILKIDTEKFKFDETLELGINDSHTIFYKGLKHSGDSISYSGRDLIAEGPF